MLILAFSGVLIVLGVEPKRWNFYIRTAGLGCANTLTWSKFVERTE
jgi:hypothetical protein